MRHKILFKATIKLVHGYLLYKVLRIAYGKNTHIFLMRGKTGDSFLYFRFLEAYIKENNIDKFILVGDGKGVKAICELYPNLKAEYIPVSEYTGEALQNVWCFLGEKNLKMSLSLMWDVKLPYNRCAVRLTTPFNFIDSYYWFLFDLNKECVQPTKAVFKPIDDRLRQKMIKEGYVQNKTVILSPYAYCVKQLPAIFWILLGKDLQKRGYKVFVMLDKENEKNEFGFKSTFFSYSESKAFLEYAGHFIGLRSGFCDIISYVDCHKIILYPQRPKCFDGSVHRADLDYSSLVNMELSKTSVELTLPFARNITCSEAETEDFEKHIYENKEIAAKILNEFPYIT